MEGIEAGIEVFDLGRPLFVGMPQSPNHPEFHHAMPRRHGDQIRADGTSAANDLLVLGTHVGTHIDALGHVSHDGKLFGGANAQDAQRGGRLSSGGMDEFQPFVGRGVLLDVPAALGLDSCEPAYEISPEDLLAAVERQATPPQPGGAVLVRSGWGKRWDEGPGYVGRETGVPGPGEEGAAWLAARSPKLVGADTIAFEHLPAGRGHAVLPAHRVLLVEHGIHIVETLALEELASAAVYEFLFVLAPLRIVGGTGSPVRPLAVVGRRRS
jgi:kynurenine formamidase